MAQPTNYIFDYVYTFKVPAGSTFTQAQALALAPVGTTPTSIHLMSESVKIGVGGGDMVTWKRGDLASLKFARSWTFSDEAEVALAQLVDVTIP